MVKDYHQLLQFDIGLQNQSSPRTLGSQVSFRTQRQRMITSSMAWRVGCVPMWLSKWITDTGPQLACVPLKADSVVVWSPPSAMILGTDDFAGFAAGRDEAVRWAWSNVLIAARLSRTVMGASPQSMTFAQSRRGSRPSTSQRLHALTFQASMESNQCRRYSPMPCGGSRSVFRTARNEHLGDLSLSNRPPHK
jgi:hypothetical protein